MRMPRVSGLLRWSDIVAALKGSRPALAFGARDFADCRYRKGARTCAKPQHFPRCPLPLYPMRKGSLNQSAYSLALFIRDACAGDFVGWIDQRLAAADQADGPDRADRLRAAV